MSDPGETSAQLSTDQKRILISQMLQNRASQPRDRPLSFGQERLWLLTQINPDKPLYNISVAYRIQGLLNLAALEKSVRSIAQRHEVLRTTFPSVLGRPIQRISPEVGSALLVEDRRLVPDEQRMLQAQDIVSKEATRLFDLSRQPAWRVVLIRLSEEESILLLTMHHIVSDGWSFALFCQELSESYRALHEGVNSSMADLPLQYAAFGERQRQSLTGQPLAELTAYWGKQFERAVPALKLPVDRPPAPAPTHRGARLEFVLSEALSNAITHLSQSESATVFMTLLAAFQALLHQYSGQDDLLLSTPVIGRHRSQTKNLIGYFNNILPLRFDLDENPSFRELIRRTRQVALDAYKHQDLPFQHIVEMTNLKHISASRVLFSLDMKWPPELTLFGLTTSSEDVQSGTADFDLSVSIWEEGSRLHGAMKYKIDLFDNSTIDRLISQYRNLLENLVAEPEKRLNSLPRLGNDKAASTNGINAQGRAPYLPPRTPTELRVAKEWELILGIQPIGVDDDILALGASSLTIAQLSERLQSLFNAEISLATVFQSRTVARFTALLEAKGTARPASPLAAIQPHGSRPPLFLCEGIGLYFPLIRYLAADQPLYGLVTEAAQDYPGVETLAAHYVQEIQKVQPTGPYFVGGASFGGLVAFEMAQQLRAKGEEVALLALFDTAAPGATTQKPFLRKLAGHLGNVGRFGLPYVKKAGRDRFSRIARKAKRTLHRPQQVAARIARSAELRQMFRTSAAKYEVRPYPGRITLFCLAHRDGMTDSLFDPALVEVDEALGWGQFAGAGVEIHHFPGEHITIFQEPYVRVLGEQLQICLERAQAQRC